MLYAVQTSRERCASNNISRDNEILCLLLAFILQFRASGKVPFKILSPLAIFLHIHTKQFRVSGKAHFSGHEGKHHVVLAT